MRLSRFLILLAGLLTLAGVAAAEDSIYTIQLGLINNNTPVDVQGVVVTAVGRFGVFVQEPNPDPTYGRQYSGIWVYTNSIPTVRRGDLVNVRGMYYEYFGFSEIDTTPTYNGSVTYAGQGTVPDPVNVSIPEVNNQGSFSEPYESVLIRVDREDATLYAGRLDSHNEWHLKRDQDVTSAYVQMDQYSALPTGDFTYDVPDSGSLLTYAQGILVYNFNEYKIAPRNCDEDLGTACRPKLRGAYGTSSTGVAVQFGVPVTQATAENIANYQLGSGLLVHQAHLDPSNHKRVFLVTDDLGNGEQETITARNVMSESGAIMSGPETQAFRTGLTPIAMIQQVDNPAVSDVSNLVGEIVTVRARVVALEGANYYYLQDDDGGPWDGLYCRVARGTVPLHIGDKIDVAGQVTEYFGMTELNYKSGVDYSLVLGETGPVVTNTLHTSDLKYRDTTLGAEPWEDCLIRLESARLDSITGVAGPYFGEWLLFQRGYADTAKFDINGLNGDKAYAACIGDTINLTGMLAYTFNQYQVWPRTGRGVDIQVIYDNPACSPSSVEEVGTLTRRDLAGVPNPFNPKTTIRYTLPASGLVRLEIVDPSGRIVRTLVDQVTMSAGTQQTVWDGKDDAGRPAGTGTYFARLRTAEGAVSTKLVLLK
jgi:hypothetical protein